MAGVAGIAVADEKQAELEAVAAREKAKAEMEALLQEAQRQKDEHERALKAQQEAQRLAEEAHRRAEEQAAKAKQLAEQRAKTEAAKAKAESTFVKCKVNKKKSCFVSTSNMFSKQIQKVCTRVWKMSVGFCGECGSSLEGCEEVDQLSEGPVSPLPTAAHDKKKGDDKERVKREKMQKGTTTTLLLKFLFLCVFYLKKNQKDLENIFTGLDKNRIREVLTKHNYQLDKSTEELLSIQREVDR